MQNYIKKQQIKVALLSLFEAILLLVLFLVSKSETNDFDFTYILIGLGAFFVLINFLYTIFILVKISKSKKKSDVITSDILGEEIDEIYKFGKIGIVITDDNNKIIWTNDWLPNSQFELIDKDIFAWQKDLEKLVTIDYSKKAKDSKKESQVVKININNVTYEVRCIKGPHVFLFKDISEMETINKYSNDHLPAIGVIMLDNYSDVSASTDDLTMNIKMAQIHNLIAEYAKEYNLLIKKFRADSYLVLCTNESY